LSGWRASDFNAHYLHLEHEGHQFDPNEQRWKAPASATIGRRFVQRILPHEPPFPDRYSLSSNRRIGHHASLEPSSAAPLIKRGNTKEESMDGLIYLIGLIVIVMAILSFFGLR